VIDPTALRRRAEPIDRSSDRLVALTSIAIAVAYLLAAAITMLLPAADRIGAWLPLHLALAGGATTAIAGVMPFFVAAFAAAPPSDARLRSAAVGSVAIGAGAVAAGVGGAIAVLAVVGGVGFLAGIVLTGAATVRPLQHALGPSRGMVTRGYLLALVEVAVGATLATLFLAGWPPVVEAWARLKPAHAWLNLVGFVSLVIATTLLHFFPTVVGARISVRPSARLTVGGLASGAALVALGFALGTDVLVRLGALAVLAGSTALAVYAGGTWQTRATWTTDPGWHRFATGGLVSSIAWFEIGIAVAAGRLLVVGAASAGWAVDAAMGPIVFGWMGLAIVASASHLVPAIGPGDPLVHGRQRTILGRAAASRLGLIDVGVAVTSLGLVLGLGPPVVIGAASMVVGFGATAGLLGIAVAIGLRARPDRG
jgi:nitrite reductase (NO-forming)